MRRQAGGLGAFHRCRTSTSVRLELCLPYDSLPSPADAVRFGSEAAQQAEHEAYLRGWSLVRDQARRLLEAGAEAAGAPEPLLPARPLLFPPGAEEELDSLAETSDEEEEEEGGVEAEGHRASGPAVVLPPGMTRTSARAALTQQALARRERLLLVRGSPALQPHC